MREEYLAMDYPSFTFQEIVLRLAEFDPQIGNYLSHFKGEHGYQITTTGGLVRISAIFIDRQYHRPQGILTSEIALLAAGFMAV